MRGMRAYRSCDLRYDQYLIVIAGDVWRISGDEKGADGGEYIGEFTGKIMYDAVQIDSRDIPKTVIETAQLIAMECYAEDWRDFSPYPHKVAMTKATP